ncbi:MAG: hypothetical protein MSA31_08695 [Bacteroidales bacterium]|nr:hypothetical protein [Bacteroidales bacterium]
MKKKQSPPRPLGDIIRQYLLTDNNALAIAWRRRKKEQYLVRKEKPG